jgi:two-component system, OmpR family, sensor kinase
MIQSLRGRLLVGLLALVVAGLLVADLGTYLSLQSFLMDRVDKQLFASRDAVVGMFLDEHHGPGPQMTAAAGGTYFEIRAPDGSSIHGSVAGPGQPSSSAHPQLPAQIPVPEPSSQPTFQSLPGSGGVNQYRVLIYSPDRGPAMGDTVIIAIPLTDVQATLDNLLLFEGLISAAVLLALALFAWSVIGVGLRPLERMGSTAKAIAAGDLSRRVEPATPRTEIGRLGLALNGMLSQIEMAFAERTRSEQRLRRFLADASHELRTPLTSIRGYAELLRRGAAQTAEDSALARRRIEAEAIRMSVMVDDLLLLARLDQGRPLDQAPVDLQQIAHDACADARAVAPSRAITLWAREAVVVRGDELRLRQVVANLVSNAIVHTPTGTPIEVTVTSNGERAALSVTDHGPGLKGEETGRVFEPFYRADPGRSRDRGGSGLGLSIVAAVVTAHGGVVQVLETPGGGATFRVELPRAGARAEIEETARKPEVRARSA